MFEGVTVTVYLHVFSVAVTAGPSVPSSSWAYTLILYCVLGFRLLKQCLLAPPPSFVSCFWPSVVRIQTSPCYHSGKDAVFTLMSYLHCGEMCNCTYREGTVQWMCKYFTAFTDISCSFLSKKYLLITWIIWCDWGWMFSGQREGCRDSPVCEV